MWYISVSLRSLNDFDSSFCGVFRKGRATFHAQNALEPNFERVDVCAGAMFGDADSSIHIKGSTFSDNTANRGGMKRSWGDGLFVQENANRLDKSPDRVEAPESGFSRGGGRI